MNAPTVYPSILLQMSVLGPEVIAQEYVIVQMGGYTTNFVEVNVNSGLAPVYVYTAGFVWAGATND